MFVNPLSANFTKWANTLKQFVGNLPTNCLNVFGHFVGLALKRVQKYKIAEKLTLKSDLSRLNEIFVITNILTYLLLVLY